MNILGISAHFHDSSAALCQDGVIVAAIAEDRLTHVKHDASFPLFAIDFCLEQGGVEPSELDAVVFYEEPHVKFGRVLTLLLANFPRSAMHFARAMGPWLTTHLWMKTIIANRLGVDPGIVSFVPHHVSHASQAFLSSGFEEAAVLTLDGVGEWTTMSIGRGSLNEAEGVELLETSEYPNSLGLAFAAVTGFLGFKPNDQECSTMALAAFGEPKYLERFREVMTVADGKLRLDRDAFNFMGDHSSALSPAFAKDLGLIPRALDAPYGFDIFADCVDAGCATDRAYANVAASLQARTNEIVLELSQHAQAVTGADRLCVAGGVAYNSVSIAHLIRYGPFREVYVPPDPGDAGGAVGAALIQAHRAGAIANKGAMQHPYLGAGSQIVNLGAVLDKLDLNEVPPPPVEPPGDYRVEASWQHLPDEADLIEQTAEELASGKIVGWVQGRSEFGPRALGNRSILADPSDVDLARRISRHIKLRQPHRPFALSIAEEDAAYVLDLPDGIPQPARWMQMVVPVLPDARERVRGALHVDGTTRPQVCGKSDNGLFHALLSGFRQKTGLSALLNTSLNLTGLPLCASAPEALVMFWSCDIDTLVINDWILRKGTA
ncbi:carbamoyltransferase family protein [Parasedimentitalea maritima]|uniref:Carbamoyl transferase n=1 Tax=Parasedimentitalea maritima TaxID=2578117 RepID=A0A6A4R963_9RHOB|nr:carbamoyltransferase N-terminal domain-containing protein [Zongyanglinia marina]KAE9624746.1 carbamoyl transferase [Zongyanglinia marina]